MTESDTGRELLWTPSKDRIRASRATPEATAVNRATVANPDVLDWYADYAARYRRRRIAGGQRD